MVVPPGYSISDLIQAAGQVKKIYDSFKNENTNSAAQLRDLVDDIELFRAHLKEHERLLENQGLQYGNKAVRRTLDQCESLVRKYREVFNNSRRPSFLGAYKTVKFAYEQDEIQRLRDNMRDHKFNIIISKLEILNSPENLTRQSSIALADCTSTLVPEFDKSSSISPPPTPKLLGSPVLAPKKAVVTESSFSRSSTLVPSFSIDKTIIRKSVAPSVATPTTPTEPPSSSFTSIFTSSPPEICKLDSPENGSTIPELILPQPALLYTVADVDYGDWNGKKGKVTMHRVTLNRKPVGRDFYGSECGRELIIIGDDQKERFRHKIIKKASTDACYPYTWISLWHKDHPPLSVTFKGSSSGTHFLSIKAKPFIPTTPTYIFTTPTDFYNFQSAVRGKKLEFVFEVQKISSGSKRKRKEATDQHLKIWRDAEGIHSLSFYASAATPDRDLEFPLHMFCQDLVVDKDKEYSVKLEFETRDREGILEAKRARTSTRSGTFSSISETTTSSTTTVPCVFSGIASSESSATSVNSRLSITSLQQARIESTLEDQAKKIKCLYILFDNENEIERFINIYQKLYNVEQEFNTLGTSNSINSDISAQVMNWRRRAVGARKESLNVSPGTTPLDRSPELAANVRVKGYYW